MEVDGKWYGNKFNFNMSCFRVQMFKEDVLQTACLCCTNCVFGMETLFLCVDKRTSALKPCDCY